MHRLRQAGLVEYLWIERVMHWQTTPTGIAKLAEPPPPGRVACINPACGRTWKMNYEGEEVICNTCFKLVPELRAQYRAAWAAYRKANRSPLKRLNEPLMMALKGDCWRAWASVREAFTQKERPEGIDAFLREIGLKDGDEE